MGAAGRTAPVTRLRLVDRHLLRLAAPALAGTLAVTLCALMLERALRLHEALAGSEGGQAYLLQLLATLLPYYLGLTLPAAFFVAMFTAYARLSDGSEVDALLASGVSPARLAAPYLVLGAVLGAASLLISGWIDPYSRYAYREILHRAQTAGWNGRFQSQVFVTAGGRTSLTADAVDETGRRLRGVFIRETTPRGRERVTTARRGYVRPGADAHHVVLVLTDGQQVRRDQRDLPQVLTFTEFDLELTLPAADAGLRARGLDERELTLSELAFGRAGDFGPTRRRRTAELYGRLARALALPLLPLLTLPLSLSAKRGGRAAGVVTAAVLLFVFQHLLQVGQGLAAKGRAPPVLAVGLPFAAYAALSAWVFAAGLRRPGETPFSIALEALRTAARRTRRPDRPSAPAVAPTGAATWS